MSYSAALLADSLGGTLKSEVRLKVTVLGGFHAQLDPGRALVLPTKKAQALLAYLALPPGQAHPREKLATLLWGDMATPRLGATSARPSRKSGRPCPRPPGPG